VREALRLLASQHLIVTTRGVTGGSFVAHPSPHLLADTLSTGVHLMLNASTVSAKDLIDVREMLEVPAAGLAALRRTEAHLSALRAATFDPELDDLDERLSANRRFHRVVATASGNPLLEVLTSPLYQVSNEREVVETMDTPPDWAIIDSQHREILRHITARDPEGARAAATAHMGYLRRIVDGPACR